MTISNKYNADFCVLTIKVVGYAHLIGVTKRMVENVFLINFRKWPAVKSRSGVECGQMSQIELGVKTKYDEC
ncbi:MAG: hypothetical protein WBX01_07545 [Nitrososphaeraceae archaeon]